LIGLLNFLRTPNLRVADHWDRCSSATISSSYVANIIEPLWGSSAARRHSSALCWFLQNACMLDSRSCTNALQQLQDSCPTTDSVALAFGVHHAALAYLDPWSNRSDVYACPPLPIVCFKELHHSKDFGTEIVNLDTITAMASLLMGCTDPEASALDSLGGVTVGVVVEG
jgi:hypothetical protein